MTERKWTSGLCLACKHFNWDKYGTCKAFPEGIPHIIVSGEINHFENVEGDNGLKFEEKEK